MTTLSLMSTWPPVESNIRLPVDVSTVLAAFPTRTLFAARDVAEATPKFGVTSVGVLANTKAPEPVSSVTAVAKFADEGVIKNAVIPTPTPVELPIGIVQLVRVPEDGVPKAGVTRTGEVANTKAPEPVSSEMTPANCKEVVAANTLRLFPVVVRVPAVGNVTLVAAVVVNVKAKAPEVVREELFAKVKVASVAGAVKTTLLILVAVATPKTGVIRVGVLANTFTPVPVLSVSADAKFADEGVIKNAVTPVPVPVTFPTGIVQLVRVPEVGVPKTGVTRVGVLANTKAPLPVSSVTAVAKFADEGVIKNAVTPVPVPVALPTGMVQLVRVPEVGVPKTGVTRVGVLANTKAPEPVSSDITPANCNDVVAANTLRLLPAVVKVPAVGKVTLVAAVVVSVRLKAPEVANVELSANVKVAAVAGAVKATLLILVAVATPKTGVIRVGVLANTLTPVPVLSVSADAKFADEGVIKNAVTPVPVPVTLPTGIVQLVRVPEVGVPKTGVTRVGEVANTKAPLPVSSDITPANSKEEVAACTFNLSVVTTSVLLVGIVVVLIVPETVALEYTRVFVFGL
jgi:hypothetical protein